HTPPPPLPPPRAPRLALLSGLPGLIEITSKAVGICNCPRLAGAWKKPVKMGTRNAAFLLFLMISPSRQLLILHGIEKRLLISAMTPPGVFARRPATAPTSRRARREKPSLER